MDDDRQIHVVARSFEARCQLDSVLEQCRQARLFLAALGLTETELQAWQLTLVEATCNAVKHSRDEGRNLPVRLDLLAEDGRTEARVTDHTPGFDWPECAGLPDDASESGRGRFIIEALTDEVHYLRGQSENCLVLRKRRPPAST